MPKLNVHALPRPQVKVRAVPLSAPGQGEATVYLRAPNFPDRLHWDEPARERIAQWCKPGANRYPDATYIPMSEMLWHNVTAIVLWQCDEHGNPLPEEDAYTEHDLILMSVTLEEGFLDLCVAVNDLLDLLEQRSGNSSGVVEGISSEPVSTTPTLTQT
jgi:hypothetical protein